jgi:hypothetical protein
MWRRSLIQPSFLSSLNCGGRRPTVHWQLNLIGLAYSAMFLLVGCPVEADSQSEQYAFDCRNVDTEKSFSALDHVFLIPNGFEVDPNNENYFNLTSIGSVPGVLDVEVLSLIIQYGPVDELVNENWNLAATKDEIGLGFSVYTQFKNPSYGSVSYWAAYVGDSEQVVIYSKVPFDWRSFLNCMIS